MKLKISQVCKAISSIKMPSTTYPIGEEVPISLPIEVATIPNVTKVIAVPAANVAEYKNAFLVFLSPVSPTYPTIKGTPEREQGVTRVLHYRNWRPILVVDMVRTEIHTNAALRTSHIINDWIPFLCHNWSLLFKYFFRISRLCPFERAHHS